MTRRAISWVLAALLLLGLAVNWRLALWVLGVRDPLGLVVGVSWLALLLTSVIGLSRVRRWGAYTLIVLAPLSTVMLAAPLLPGMHVVGLKGPLGLVVWNVVALLGAIIVLRTPASSARAA